MFIRPHGMTVTGIDCIHMSGIGHTFTGYWSMITSNIRVACLNFQFCCTHKCFECTRSVKRRPGHAGWVLDLHHSKPFFIWHQHIQHNTKLLMLHTRMVWSHRNVFTPDCHVFIPAWYEHTTMCFASYHYTHVHTKQPKLDISLVSLKLWLFGVIKQQNSILHSQCFNKHQHSYCTTEMTHPVCRRDCPEDTQVSCLCRQQDLLRERKFFMQTTGQSSCFLMGVNLVCDLHHVATSCCQFRVRTNLD